MPGKANYRQNRTIGRTGNRQKNLEKAATRPASMNRTSYLAYQLMYFSELQQGCHLSRQPAAQQEGTLPEHHMEFHTSNCKGRKKEEKKPRGEEKEDRKTQLD